MLLKKFYRIDFIHNSLEVTTNLSLSPHLIIDNLPYLFQLFGLELYQKLLLVLFRSLDNVQSTHLKMGFQVVSQSKHENMHLLEVICTYFLLIMLLSYPLPITLKFLSERGAGLSNSALKLRENPLSKVLMFSLHHHALFL